VKKARWVVVFVLMPVLLLAGTFKTSDLLVHEPEEAMGVEKADRPRWTLDDQWMAYSYKGGKPSILSLIRVKEIWDDRYVLDHVRFDKNINFEHGRNFFFSVCQYMRYFHWPLMVGKKWEGETKCKEKDDGPEIPVKYEVLVTTLQWLYIPGYYPETKRKIKAFRLVLHLTGLQSWINLEYKRDSMEYFYSPDDKIIVEAADFKEPRTRLYVDRVPQRYRRKD